MRDAVNITQHQFKYLYAHLTCAIVFTLLQANYNRIHVTVSQFVFIHMMFTTHAFSDAYSVCSNHSSILGFSSYCAEMHTRLLLSLVDIIV